MNQDMHICLGCLVNNLDSLTFTSHNTKHWLFQLVLSPAFGTQSSSSGVRAAGISESHQHEIRDFRAPQSSALCANSRGGGRARLATMRRRGRAGRVMHVRTRERRSASPARPVYSAHLTRIPGGRGAMNATLYGHHRAGRRLFGRGLCEWLLRFEGRPCSS